MPIFLQTSSTGVPSSACFSAKAICCSVNLLLFTAWLLFYGGIMPEFLFLNGTIYWVGSRPTSAFAATTIDIAACRSAGGFIRFDVFLSASRDREDKQLTSAAASRLTPCPLKPPVLDFPWHMHCYSTRR